MQNIIIKNIEGQEIDIEIIKNEIKELRASGKRKVEEKLLKDYIKNGIVQFKNENEEWEDLEGDNKEKINEVIEMFKNLEKTEEKSKKLRKEKKEDEKVEEKPKKGRKAKKEVKVEEVAEVKVEEVAEVKVEEVAEVKVEEKPKKVRKTKKVETKKVETKEKEKFDISTKLIDIFETLKNSDDEVKRDVIKIVDEYLEKLQKEIQEKENLMIKEEEKEILKEVKIEEKKMVFKENINLNDLKLESYEKTEEISENQFEELNELECLIDEVDE